MSVYIDTQTRCKISNMYNVITTPYPPFAVDPNGVRRYLNIGNLIYSTDTVHVTVQLGGVSSYDQYGNYTGTATLIQCMGRLNNTWDLSRGLGIVWEQPGDIYPDRWFVLDIAGTANNSQVTLASSPDFNTPRDW